MSSNKFDTDYLKWLQQLDVEEDDTVWEKIQDELDFIETWDNISSELDRINPPTHRLVSKPYINYISAAAAVILLLLASVFYFREYVKNPIQSEPILAEEKQIEKEINTSSEINREDHSEDSASESRSGQEVSAFHGKAKKEYRSVLFSENKENIDNKETAQYIKTAEDIENKEITGNIDEKGNEYASERIEKPGIAEIQNLRPEIKDLLASNAGDLSSAVITPDLPVTGSGRTSKPFLRISDVGVSYSYKNTWLLNYETINGLNPRKLGNTLLTFHQDMGVLSTIAIKDHHNIGLEFFWRSETGQKYQQYIDASYVNRNIKLDYFKFQSYYIWDHRSIPGRIIIGGYIGKLKMAVDVQGGIMFNVNDRYRNLDYGLLLGHQYNMLLKNKIFISPGFRVNYDFINIYQGDVEAFNPFKKTNKLAACINIAISYRLVR